MKTKRLWFLISVTCLFVFSSFSAFNSLAATKQQIAFGAMDSTGSGYPMQVSITQVINEAVPEVNVSLIGGGGTVDLLTKFARGQFHISPADSGLGRDLKLGVGKFAGNPFTKARLFLTQEQGFMAFVVTKESGITTLEQLDGKNFFPGHQGSAAQADVKKAFEMWGIQPKYFSGSITDGTDALQNRRVVGMAKYGPLLGGAFFDRISATLPLNFLYPAEEKIQQVVDRNEGAFIKVVVPAGTHKGQDKPITSWGFAIEYHILQDLSEEVVYKMFKAIHQDWMKGSNGKIGAAKPATAKTDPLEMLLDSANSGAVPLHPGVIKYLREMNQVIPANGIPPEMRK
ncbi:MAG: TAXI family TRAP transporter solute-binding subunit [Deltaproteobacteria bacterium]|nr:TAXI family TRAP transporter solute-binding subunit [Deltaproteobacteria bacterium]